jgi:amino acid adenylation domain-containing protein
VETPTTIHAALQYSTALFDEATMQSWADHLVVLLEEITADPDRPVSLLPILTPGDSARLAALNDTAADVTPATIVDLFRRQNPDRTAVIDCDRHTTYRRLDEDSDRLAHGLHAQGVRPGDLVALVLPRGTELVTAMLAVLKTGAAYLPIDVTTPAARIAQLLDDAAPALVLTDNGIPDAPAVALPTVLPGQPAYLIYTSGSTGTPKGVLIPHHNLTNLVTATAREYGFGPDDTWTLFHSPAFDFAVWEIWGPLLTGGRLVIADNPRDPAAFAQLLVQQRVTVLNQTPSAFAQLTPPAGHRVRLIIFGGEKLEQHHLRQQWAEATLINMYGITETTIHVTHQHIDHNVSIGVPLPNYQVHLLDQHLQPVPPGTPGEIHVAGPGLAHGYRGQPALTAERFIPGPAGQRLYRSGDRARLLPDGTLEYLGRTDHQLKIRGHRIEPTEVENALTVHPRISTAVVTGQDDRLIAYIVPGGDVPAIDELRTHLASLLPPHMVPSVFVPLTALPLNTNGKLDRAALPTVDSERPDLTASYQAPATPTEQTLAEIWSELLGLSKVGIDDDFFDLGGHSLLATQAMSRIRSAFKIELPLTALFDQPTIRALAVVVTQHLLGDNADAEAYEEFEL